MHPSEKSADSFLTPANAKNHIIGITESVERDGPYLKGSLVIFHEDAIKAIESGERKETSLGYKCRLEPISGSINGEAYDAVQRDIVVNHVAIGPKGWGRAGPDCSIRTDSQTLTQGNLKMTEVVRFDGIEVPLTADSVVALLSEKKRQLQEINGRVDAMGLELEKEKAARAALEDPQALEQRVQSRLSLIEKCRSLFGHECIVDGKSDAELKREVIKKFCKLPTIKSQLEKPLGITLGQLHCQHYESKSSIAVMRKGRVWIEADRVNAPGDAVYLKFVEDGTSKFTGDKKDNARLFGAIFLEKSDGGLTPIEINFFGGAQ